MTTQVVVFSVMLFGTSGVVLDFGRVYSEHSQMQSFTDQAALAAASELDKEADSIDRAVASVFGTGSGSPMSKSALFSEGEGNQFNISHLFFLRDLSDDSGAQTDIGSDLNPENLIYTAFADGSAAGSKPDAALRARYVIAVAEERSVRNSLMMLINSTGSDTVQETNSVRTIATAKRQQLSCGQFSNLVICNPWEDQNTQNYETIAADPTYSGLQFATVADGQISDGQMSFPYSLARRQDLEGNRDVKEICNDPLRLPGFSASNTTAQNETARVICMLAAARADDFCEAEELKFVPAEPEVIATALNTAFDMWDEPIASVLDWDRDAGGRTSMEPGWSGAAHPLRESSPLFQPDINILKGRVFHKPTAITNAALGIPESSRLNYRAAAGGNRYRVSMTTCLRNVGGTSADVDCLRDEDGNIIPYIGDTSRSLIGTNPGFFSAYYRSVYNQPFLYQNRDRAASIATYFDLYLDERGPDAQGEFWTHTENGILSPIPFIPGYESIPAGGAAVSMFHESGSATLSLDQKNAREDGSLSLYVRDSSGVRQIQKVPAYDDAGNPLDEFAADEFGNEIPGSSSDGFQDLVDAYPNYTYTDPITQDVDRSLQRRVFDVTLINCGETVVNGNGENVAPIAGYAKMTLMNPPEVTCPGGGEACLNSQLSSVRVITEFVREADYEPKSFAVLVR